MAFRQTCFDTLVYISTTSGLKNIDKILTKQDIETLNNIRQQEVKVMYENWFALSYYTSLTKQDIDSLTLFELETWIDLLISHRKLESELRETNTREK